MSGYCKIAPGHAVHHSYHANEYGVPLDSERELFERLCLEIFQAGLSWEIVLKKRPLMVKAFHKFNVDKVAAYNAADVKRLLADPGIIRNRLKVAAIIENAKRIIAMRKTHDGLAGFLAQHHPLSKTAWVKLFKKHFKFVGGEIVGEFLMSIGYLPGSHAENCAVYKRLKKDYALPWLTAQKKGFKYS
ncbi:MAG: DNA-3-methyladenine glycosylase I [Alphaproteobacteria bacterium]|nr:DNA-3-methyladenine glycosylase I [Alphaproteobacteria bacterium]